VEQEVIEKLPASLRDELIYDANGYFLEFIPWLKKNFCEDFLRSLSLKVKELNVLQNETIIYGNYN